MFWYACRSPTRCATSAPASTSSAASSRNRLDRKARSPGSEVSVAGLPVAAFRPRPSAATGGGALPDAEDVLGFLAGHGARVPWWRPDQVHLNVARSRQARTDAVDLALQHRPDGASRTRERHVHLDVIAVHIDAVDEAQVDDVEADLGVDHGLECFPDQLRRQRLRRLIVTVRVQRGSPIGFSRLGCFLVDIHLAYLYSATSVAWPASWACSCRPCNSEFQGSTAHLIRTGYFFTPCSASRSPSSSPPPSASIISLKLAITLSASARGFPRTCSVIIEADAWLMEQPRPLKCSSLTAAPSGESRAVMVTSSPQSGSLALTRTSAGSRSPLLRGLR